MALVARSQPLPCVLSQPSKLITPGGLGQLLTQITIRTFCWVRSEPIPAIWNVKAGIVVAGGSSRIFFIQPVAGSHIPLRFHVCSASLIRTWPATLEIAEADAGLYGMTNKVGEGGTFYDPAGDKWERLRSEKTHLLDAAYATRYVHKFDLWCESNPRAAWGLRRMKPGSKLRNKYTKQIIGTAKKPLMSPQTIIADLWGHADLVETALRDHNAEQAEIKEATNVDTLRHHVADLERLLRSGSCR